jgi:hypothetical protein
MRWVLENGDEGEEKRRDWTRDWKTSEDQGVPWMKTRVLRLFGDGPPVGWSVGGEMRLYLIVQPAWWKVEGRLLGAAALGRDISC